jgi:arabinogalactan endo-1,4-beta-galactosidase
MRIIFLTLIAAVAVLATNLAGAGNVFLSGADFSDLAFFEAHNVHYKDGGTIQDGLQILKQHGINCVRLRIWTSSSAQASGSLNNAYNFTNNLAYNLPLALRVKNAGLLFLLDFHYSDTWSDPGHQAKPSTWSSLTADQLVQQMRTYNSNTIAAFAAEGAMPDYVQIGNEITGGLLWTNGGPLSGSFTPIWAACGNLMKASVRGIQDATTTLGIAMPKIIVHIDRGGDWTTTEWFFDNLNFQGVPYDIIGESYYPFYHGPLTGLSNCLYKAAARYNKPMIVAETAFPWNNTSWHSNNIFGIPLTTNGQVSFIAALAQVVKGVPNQLAMGVFYWGAEYQSVSGLNEAGFNTTSFFEASGNVLPVIDAMGGMGAPLVMGAAVGGKNVQLTWPFSGAASQLLTSTSLSPSAVWSPVPITAQVTGTVFNVAVPMTNQAVFYRLH